MTQGPSYFCYLAARISPLVDEGYGDDIDHRLGTSTTQDLTVLVNPSGRIYVHHDVENSLTLSISPAARSGKRCWLIAGWTLFLLSSTPSGTPILIRRCDSRGKSEKQSRCHFARCRQNSVNVRVFPNARSASLRTEGSLPNTTSASGFLLKRSGHFSTVFSVGPIDIKP